MIGLHIDTGHGFRAAVDTVRDLGAEAVQIFTCNPSSWRSRSVDAGPARAFTDALRAAGVGCVVSHANYLINLAGPDPVMYAKSKSALADELRRGVAYGLDNVIVHIGSHRGSGLEVGLDRITEAVEEALAAVPAQGSPRLLLENSAGTGDNVGGRVEELGELMRRLSPHIDRVGLCLDTCHASASGYDLTGPQEAFEFLEELDAAAGLGNVRVVHANDTQVPVGGRADRHWHIGEGVIGLETFGFLLHEPRLKDLPFILETPGNESVEGRRNLETLRSLL